MQGINQIQKTNPNLAQRIIGNGGFLTSEDMPEIIKINRLMMVLVRCGNGRFLCPAQDLEHFMTIIQEHSQLTHEKTGQPEVACGDYVRDVSLPA